ncbi:precorrin-2 C(20)-methyltransferase [Aurantimonas sp. Leaf443]|uniref:precorrin-2 C(20)-methyltransferase n=1 Tax=Aurantimonas sp. Leaf443 TaxID=1736378 RepID=UPI0006FB79BB|nr:precorrin-2 C(20)-methyltransferase [Aurantimonas sp. Leaf443]KQT83088.1 precorrin-2 C(20)-methyltransferase [Aurantimonas sp. Leaf443]
MTRAPGTLYGIGLGPGDPELLTLKAVRLLRAAPVIAYPAAEGQASLARSIAAPHLPGAQREIAFPMPMRTDRAPARAVYDAAARAIAAELREGRDVAALCEGDPFFYGSFIYLFERLAPRFPVEVVPGIASVMAAAAAARRPLAARGDVLTIVPGPLEDADLEARLAGCQSFAILKLGRHFERVRALLDRLGLLDACAFAERVSMPGERLTPLREASGPAPYFSMILGYRGTEPAMAAGLPRSAVPA